MRVHSIYLRDRVCKRTPSIFKENICSWVTDGEAAIGNKMSPTMICEASCDVQLMRFDKPDPGAYHGTRSLWWWEEKFFYPNCKTAVVTLGSRCIAWLCPRLPMQTSSKCSRLSRRVEVHAKGRRLNSSRKITCPTEILKCVFSAWIEQRSTAV